MLIDDLYKQKAISVLETNTAFKINALDAMVIIFIVIAKLD